MCLFHEFYFKWYLVFVYSLSFILAARLKLWPESSVPLDGISPQSFQTNHCREALLQNWSIIVLQTPPFPPLWTFGSAPQTETTFFMEPFLGLVSKVPDTSCSLHIGKERYTRMWSLPDSLPLSYMVGSVWTQSLSGVPMGRSTGRLLLFLSLGLATYND